MRDEYIDAYKVTVLIYEGLESRMEVDGTIKNSFCVKPKQK